MRRDDASGRRHGTRLPPVHKLEKNKKKLLQRPPNLPAFFEFALPIGVRPLIEK